MRRKLFDKLVTALPNPEFMVLIGARQIGKTTLIKQLHQYVLDQGISSEYITLENKRYLEGFNASPENVFQYISKDKKSILFIDEIQYLNDPTNFLKHLYDCYAPTLKIVCTGSSAFYIERKFKDSLAGRKKLFELNTFSFEEYLELKESKNLIKDIQTLKKGDRSLLFYKEQIQLELEEYMIYGGYPRIILAKDKSEKEELLRELRDSYLSKDILENNIGNSIVFLKLMTLLSTQIGALLNIQELSKMLKIAIPTVENYLYILQKSFHITLVLPYHSNKQKEIIKMPKVYFNDTGMRNILIEQFGQIDLRTDKGELFENFIFKLFIDKIEKRNIKFWRTQQKNEVDFIVQKGLEIEKAIEVKYSDTNISMTKYNVFHGLYPEAKLNFITMDRIEELVKNYT